MNKYHKLLAGAMVAGMSLLPGTWEARADMEISAGVAIHSRADFYDPLESHGAWVEVGSYGRCFRPEGVGVEWRPYCDGHWVYTDCGWFWDSDEPWAWACYHYGRWLDDPEFGWVWVPGTEWAPAWVDWRIGRGFVGWAPLPPAGISVGVGLFAFVDEHRFGEHFQRRDLIFNDPAILRRTSRVGEVRRENRDIGGVSMRVFVNSGPDVHTLDRVIGHPTATISIRDATRRMPLPRELGPAERRPEPARERTIEHENVPKGPVIQHQETPRGDERHSDEQQRQDIQRHAPPEIPAERPAEHGHGDGRSRDHGRD